MGPFLVKRLATFIATLAVASVVVFVVLELLPGNAVNELAVAHGQLGNVYNTAGDLRRALEHWRESIRCCETAGDLYHAATARYNVGRALAQAGRLADGLDYARAALRNYETYGAGAAADVEKTRGLIAAIEEKMGKGKG